ncbi:hypothetical protein GEMRC1_011667 [Eukaryota sp. GEM-RC1]
MPPLDIDWKQYAFGKGKYRRKTVGFGSYHKSDRLYDDEFYIREASILYAGLGCGLWDAAILFSRWIYHNSHIFQNKYVLELGAGVGLCGIVASRFAKKVILTDYIDSVIDNLQYNIDLNDSTLVNDSGDVPPNRKGNLNASQVCSAEILDWTHSQDFLSTIQPAENLIGSELTYSNLNVTDLIHTVSSFSTPSSVFL